MTEELKEANEFKELLGISKEDKKKVTFCEYKAKIEEILTKLNALEELACDEDLETYIVENRTSQGFLPRLRLINGVDIAVDDMEDRKKTHAAVALFNKLQRVAGHYTVSEGGMQMTAWFVNDEVGSLINHSDTPNCKMMTLLYSKTNDKHDANLMPFTVMWPTQDISANEVILRDKLEGFDEKQFRSARLHIWFETPEDYYNQQLKLWRAINLDQIGGINEQMQTLPVLQQP